MTPEQRKHFEWVRDNMHGDPQTRIADNVAWHLHQEVKKIKKDPSKKVPGDKRIDAKFNDWAKRNGLNIQEIPVMRKEKKK